MYIDDLPNTGDKDEEGRGSTEHDTHKQRRNVQNVWTESSLGCSDHGLAESGPREERTRQKAVSQLWTSLEILAFSKICLEKSHGIWSCREKEARSVG